MDIKKGNRPRNPLAYWMQSSGEAELTLEGVFLSLAR
jgi:hypothetical protein